MMMMMMMLLMMMMMMMLLLTWGINEAGAGLEDVPLGGLHAHHPDDGPEALPVELVGAVHKALEALLEGRCVRGRDLVGLAQHARDRALRPELAAELLDCRGAVAPVVLTDGGARVCLPVHRHHLRQ